MPGNGESINFVRYHSFDSSFSGDDFTNLLIFFNRWDGNPEFEFLDPEIEQRRTTFLCSLDDLLEAIALSTFVQENGRHAVASAFELEVHYAKYAGRIEMLNEKRRSTAEAYADLVRFARSRLAL